MGEGERERYSICIASQAILNHLLEDKEEDNKRRNMQPWFVDVTSYYIREGNSQNEMRWMKTIKD